MHVEAKKDPKGCHFKYHRLDDLPAVEVMVWTKLCKQLAGLVWWYL